MMRFSIYKTLHGAQGKVTVHAAAEIKQGELVGLYGASGAGKTSILRMLAGLMKPEAGQISMGDELWFDHTKRINREPQKRRTGLVFQDYALFPNMTVKENIAYPLTKGASHQIVEELLELTELRKLANRRIQTLSGGQQQRVALARAISSQPALLLLDEPLSAIDNEMRVQLQSTLLVLHRRFQLTTILVSHDLGEILRLTERIYKLENNQLQVYNDPETFLQSLGNPPGIIGNVLSANDAEEKNNLKIFVRNSILTTSAKPAGNRQYEKGQEVEVDFGENCQPTVAIIKNP